MSTAEVIKQLKVKTNTLKRVHKELSYYEKERDENQKKVDEMCQRNADPHDIKQAENVVAESAMMVPDTKQRVENAYNDLRSFLQTNHQDIVDTEELQAAEEVCRAVEESRTGAA